MHSVSLKFLVGILSFSDYYPFGMQMPGRNGGEDYRYAFNGMEHDPEVSGDGNSYTTEFRAYDSRLGRWKILDPLMAKFPHQSPYVAYDNNPIYYTDPTGMAAIHTPDIVVTGTNGSSVTIETDLVNQESTVDVDLGGVFVVGADGSYTRNGEPASVALGHEIGLAGAADIVIGVEGSAFLGAVIFLDGEYQGYWYDYIGVDGGFTAGLSLGAEFDVNANIFISFALTEKANPYNFEGQYVYSAVSLLENVTESPVSFEMKAATSEDWLTISFGLGLKLRELPDGDGAVKATLLGTGTTSIIQKIEKTEDISSTELLFNWMMHNPMTPFMFHEIMEEKISEGK
jgi:RHS repeat-associated protein